MQECANRPPGNHKLPKIQPKPILTQQQTNIHPSNGRQQWLHIPMAFLDSIPKPLTSVPMFFANKSLIVNLMLIMEQVRNNITSEQFKKIHNNFVF